MWSLPITNRLLWVLLRQASSFTFEVICANYSRIYLGPILSCQFETTRSDDNRIGAV